MARSQRTDLHQRADALLDAAAALLVGAGPRRIRIEDVAERTGVGKGTVYLHWPSREHLLVAVGAREAAAVLDAAIGSMRNDPTEVALHRYLRRHFLEAMRRPALGAIFIAGNTDLEVLAAHPARARLAASKRIAARDHLAALRAQRLLRPGLDLADVDYEVEAIAYGFFAAAPLLPDDPRFTVEHRADRLADVVRCSFEPARTPAPERYSVAAPQVIDALQRLADEFRRAAYGTAAD
ncbi:TetR family transcriptional regulator [Saccharopolyspora erythraea NRRL 2338]|uniref:HTH-type transcriptional regulator n=2 Tax=Saccharopolyspora erythraea TaxID=1836 RepID=A4FAY5_SACEN|nr:TetR/AcrR family transcriptional regulator [Saccharopolyspora erythraea]EQD87641.1 TetR family transcriptional regulator [Saccharopolyspora erythraea D]PFG94994.1 TetR family transcriptional regulator [Saccharopolyspora erythraea NRRL 2338]QRK91683.1 helix-turn-helix transcriptional regulator [Saccharopolyspora erythraea]CAM01210.1 putative HTH-type transcriptional regulator [Saccharopolyspora erythraea NRRL 2338]